jgi:membrane fusion protein (multidrug efflux system)
MAFRNSDRIAVLIAGALCVACNGDFADAISRSAGPAIPVHVETIADERSTPTLVLPAIVHAISSRSLAFRVHGRIARFRVTEGDRVEAGDVIAELDSAAGALRAPVRGVVGRRYRAAGETVSPGAPVVRLNELDTVVLRGLVPRVLLPLLRVGGSARVRSGAAGASGLAGTIQRVAAGADPHSGFAPFEVRVENRLLTLRPETVVEIAIQLASREASCTVPLAAVLRGVDSRPFAFVVIGDGVNLRVERRRVTLGGLRGSRVAVVAGLEAGDRVVSRGQDLVTVGDAVAIVGEGS